MDKNVNKGGPAKFVPLKDSRICSKHFSADVFEENGRGGKAALKPYAVPTIFKRLNFLTELYNEISYGNIMCALSNLVGLCDPWGSQC